MQTTTAPEGRQDGKPFEGTFISRFCFTINNWTEPELEWLKNFECKWMIIAKETGKKGTPHLQGACVLNRQRRFKPLKELYGFKRAHIEEMKGEPADSVKYCSKEDKNPFIKGSVEPGKRTDIIESVKKLKEATSMKELVQNDDEFAVTFVKFHHGLTRYRNYFEKTRTEPPMVFWIWGETGTGKTRTCVEWCTRMGLEFWISLGGLQWFDGYDGEPVAILDDFRTGHCKFSFLLRLLDRYKFSVPYKGGFRNWIPKYVFVTAPLPPREMFDLKKEGDIKQLERRITMVVPSPLNLEQFDAATAHLFDREASSLVKESAVHGEDRGYGSQLIIDSSGGDSSEDGETTSSSSEDSEPIFKEKQKDLKRPRYMRQDAVIDLTEEPPNKKQLIDITMEDEYEEERILNELRRQEDENWMDNDASIQQDITAWKQDCINHNWLFKNH